MASGLGGSCKLSGKVGTPKYTGEITLRMHGSKLRKACLPPSSKNFILFLMRGQSSLFLVTYREDETFTFSSL